jgi:hypothetical protein
MLAITTRNSWNISRTLHVPHTIVKKGTLLKDNKEQRKANYI